MYIRAISPKERPVTIDWYAHTKQNATLIPASPAATIEPGPMNAIKMFTLLLLSSGFSKLQLF